MSAERFEAMAVRARSAPAAALVVGPRVRRVGRRSQAANVSVVLAVAPEETTPLGVAAVDELLPFVLARRLRRAPRAVPEATRLSARYPIASLGADVLAGGDVLCLSAARPAREDRHNEKNSEDAESHHDEHAVPRGGAPFQHARHFMLERTET